MDTNTAIVIVIAVLAVVIIIAAILALQKRGGSIEGTIESFGPVPKGTFKADSKPPSAPVQTQYGGDTNQQIAAKEAASKQMQVGGKDNKQTIK